MRSGRHQPSRRRSRSSSTASSENAAVISTSSTAAAAPPGKSKHREHLPVDVGREHVGRVGGAAAGQHVDHVEDAEGVGEADDEDHRDHRLQQRQDDGEEDLRRARRRRPARPRSGRLGRLARPASSTRMSKGSAIQRLAMTIEARASQTSANHSGPLAPKSAGDRVDHAVAVDEDEAPGERADDRRDHQRQRDDGAEDLAAAKPAMQRQRDREAEDGFEDEARRDEAERLPERRLELARAGDARVVVEALEVGRAAHARCRGR